MKNKLPTTKGKSVPVKIVNDTPEAKPIENNKWRAEDALRDIERAETHKSDKALMKDVKVLAKQKMKSLSKIK